MLPTPLRAWLRELRAQRARTLMTLAGIGWGTFSVVGLLAFGKGAEDLMMERARGIGSGVVIVWPDRTTRSWRGFPAGRAVDVQPEDVLALARDVPEIEAASPEFTRTESVHRGERVLRARLNGVHPDYGRLRGMEPRAGGRFLNELDLAQRRRVAFLGNRIASQLFGDAEPVGATLVLAGAPFTVVGVLRPKAQDSDYGGLDEARVCVPYTTYQQLFGDRFVDDFVFRARDPDASARVVERVYEVLARRLGFDPADGEALAVWDTTEDVRLRRYIFLAMHVLMGGGGACTLLVGAIGVGNLMFLLVRRRTREFGVMMALGARPRWIWQEVLVQTSLLVGAGGALGFLAAVGLSLAIGASPAAEALGTPRISPAIGVGTLVALALVGLAAGSFPARRAARLDPVSAMAA